MAPAVGPVGTHAPYLRLLSGSLLATVRPYRLRLALGAVLLVLTQAFEKAVPWLGGRAVDALALGDGAGATAVAGGIVLVAVLAWGVRTLSRLQIGRAHV